MDQLKKKIQILKNHLDRFVMKSLHRRCVGLRIHEGFNEDIEFEILNQHNQHRKKENLWKTVFAGRDDLSLKSQEFAVISSIFEPK